MERQKAIREVTKLLAENGIDLTYNIHGFILILNKLARFTDLILVIGNDRRRQWHPLQYSCLENPVDREAW